MNTFIAEWTKLRTTRSFWWTTGVFFFIVWGWALLMTLMTNSLGVEQGGVLDLNAFNAIIHLMGLPVLLIQAVMVVTTEYRYGLPTTIYMANPRRWQVATTKLAMYAFLAAVIAFLGVVGAYFIGDWLGDEAVKVAYDPFGSDAGKRAMWAFPLAAALLTMFSQGLGLLMRQTAGTVAVSLILYLGLDQLVVLIPKVGDKISHYMPFTAFQRWLNEQLPPEAPWDSATGYFWVFVVWAVVLWALGVVLLHKRDV